MATREGSAGTARDLHEFRTQVGDRLDAVKAAIGDTLEKSVATLANIRTSTAEAQGATEKVLADQRVAVLQGLADGIKAVNERLAHDLGGLTEQVRVGFDGFAMGNREEQERLRTLVGGKLDEMRTGNEAKLEVIRKTVDEQLQTALEKRVGETFQRVADQLTGMMQAIGQVQAVAGEVGDLKRLFANVKVRGGWGEAQIQQVLNDMLPEGSYATNMQIGDSNEVVEFALRMPHNGSDRTLWLAIDAKFPIEDYDRLLLAAESGDRDGEAEARKALGVRIRNEAKRIEAKYVKPPMTVEYGVMFLPTEGLFAEVARVPGLIEEVRRKYHVWIVGPALLPALLHCIRVGHLTLALERKAGAIGETLGAVKAAWEDLVKALDLSITRVNGLKTQLTRTQTRAKTVGRALKTVAVIEFEAAENLLGLSDEAAVANDPGSVEPGSDDDAVDAAD
jgi:DNA recombination protein RmuC